VELTMEVASNHSRPLFAVSANADGSEQAFCTFQRQNLNPPNEGYKFFVVTDRPAYRPGDSLKWKFTARREKDGAYTTPSGETLGVTLRDQRGGELWKGTVTANEFGSAWGEVPLTDKMALGMIRMEFRKGSPTGSHLGDADVCRLEEYKLPEFKVGVQTPMVDGKRKVFRTGDIVEAEIQADYFYGEPVAGAEVEVIVRMKRIWLYWQPEREFAWYRGGRDPDPFRWQEAQEVQRESLRTDASGKALIKIPTRNFGRQPMEFTIEARVVDASRREVTGQGAVRVSPTSHLAYLELNQALHVPGGRITVTVHARDANQAPYDAQGRLTVVQRT